MAVKDGLPATDFSRMNREYIKAVAAESGGGGSGLPEITAQDEGKVLTVDTGEAVWGTVNNPFFVVNQNPENGDLDKTWQEVHDASSAGKFIVVFTDSSDEENTALQTGFISSVEYSTVGGYSAYLFSGDMSTEYTAATANDYLVQGE